MASSEPTPRQVVLWRQCGRAIQKARLAAGLTQRQLAAEIGIPIGTVRFWEIGRRIPGLAHRRWLCARLSIAHRRLQAEHDYCPRCGKPWR